MTAKYFSLFVCRAITSHVNWREEQNIIYKGVETSPYRTRADAYLLSNVIVLIVRFYRVGSNINDLFIFSRGHYPLMSRVYIYALFNFGFQMGFPFWCRSILTEWHLERERYQSCHSLHRKTTDSFCRLHVSKKLSYEIYSGSCCFPIPF